MSRLGFLKRRRVLIPLILSLIIIGLFVIGIRNLNSPAQGNIVQNNYGSSSILTPNGFQDYQDQQISFTYPDKFEVAPSQSSSGTLDVVSLISSEHRDEFVVIGVTKSTLANDSGVSYRKNHPDLYKINISRSDSIVFSKLDSTELTGFIQHNDKLVSISLTSVAPKDLATDYVVIANSLQWKQ